MNAFENEQATIGGLMCLSDLSSDAAQKVFHMVRPASFKNQMNRLVFEALVSLEKKNIEADLVTIKTELAQHGKLEAAGDVAYIADIYQLVPSAANILNYADQVRQNAIRATINSTLQNALAEFNEMDGENVYQKLGQLESLVSSLGKRSVNGRESGLVHIKEVGREWVTELEERRLDPEKHAGLSTGMDSLDLAIGPKGLVKGALCVVGARPKMGKTAFLTKLAGHVAIDLGKKVNIHSLEMPNMQIYERFLSADSKVNSTKFHTVDMTDGEFGNAIASVGKLNKQEIYLDDTPSVTLDYIKKEARRSHKESPVSLIAVDYLTLMTAGKADRTDLAFGDITKGLKELAKELDCVVLLLTQLNRGLEQRPDKRPMPSDSRDTGSIEQDADYWLGLYREGAYDDNLSKDQKGLTEIILRLNRHGETGTGYANLVNGYLESHAPFTFEKPDQKSNRNF